MKFKHRILTASLLGVSLWGLPLFGQANTPPRTIPVSSEIRQVIGDMVLASASMDFLDEDIDAQEVDRRLQKFLPLAEQGQAQAQLEAGKLYLFEDANIWELERQKPEARYLLQQMKAAEAIDNALFAKWQNQLTPSDQESAEIARQGWEQAYQSLHEMETRSHDYCLEQAEYWLSQASEQGNVQAQILLAQIYYNRALFLDSQRDREHSPQEPQKRKEAGEKSFKLLEPLAKTGYPIAQYYLATLYNKGIGAKRDFKKAALWMKRAAANDCAEAKYTMVEWYALGHGLPRDQKKSLSTYNEILSWHQQANQHYGEIEQQAQAESSENDSFYHTLRLIFSCINNVFDLEKAKAFAYQDYPTLLRFSEALSSPHSPYTQNLQSSWEIAKMVADSGDPSSARIIGERYYSGLLLPEGIKADRNEGIKWFARAAKGGDFLGELYLGALYYQGLGVPTDKNKARQLWSQALANRPKDNSCFCLSKSSTALSDALLNSSDLLIELADKADSGLLSHACQWYMFEKRFEAARKLSQIVAKRGDCESQLLAAQMCFRGLGGPQDTDQAIEYLKQAAEQNDRLAQFSLGSLYYSGDGEHLSADFSKSLEWFSKSSQNGDPAATLCLGYLTHQGLGTSQDKAHAQQLYYQACDQGVIDDLSQGTTTSDRSCCPNFDCLDSALQNLVSFIDDQASQGQGLALFWQGELYKHGIGHPQDSELARQLYERAVSTGERDVIYQVALMHFNWDGNGFADGNPNKGWELLQQAAALDHPHALSLVGRALCSGSIEGMPIVRDLERGRSLLKRAAELGNLEAEDELQIVDDMLQH